MSSLRKTFPLFQKVFPLLCNFTIKISGGLAGVWQAAVAGPSRRSESLGPRGHAPFGGMVKFPPGLGDFANRVGDFSFPGGEIPKSNVNFSVFEFSVLLFRRIPILFRAPNVWKTGEKVTRFSRENGLGFECKIGEFLVPSSGRIVTPVLVVF